MSHDKLLTIGSCDKRKRSWSFTLQLGNSSNEISSTDYNKSTFPLTPFNMKEELEEGYFDEEGTYHWKEQKTDYNDYWLENVDWNTEHMLQVVDVNNSCYTYSKDTLCIARTYKKILTYLKPKETVSKALCRLGKNTLTTSERWKFKKLGKVLNSNDDSCQKVTDLTALINGVFISTGDADIYQETYEGLLKTIEELENPFKKTEQIHFAFKESLKLDMYCDDFQEKEKLLLKNVNVIK